MMILVTEPVSAGPSHSTPLKPGSTSTAVTGTSGENTAPDPACGDLIEANSQAELPSSTSDVIIDTNDVPAAESNDDELPSCGGEFCYL